MYSDMSTRIRADASAKRNLASARASSVFPTPVGPEKMKEPMGRLGSLSPARERRITPGHRPDSLVLAYHQIRGARLPSASDTAVSAPGGG